MPSSFGTFLYISYKGKSCEALIYKGSRQKKELFSPIKVLNPADMVVFVNFQAKEKPWQNHGFISYLQ